MQNEDSERLNYVYADYVTPSSQHLTTLNMRIRLFQTPFNMRDYTIKSQHRLMQINQ